MTTRFNDDANCRVEGCKDVVGWGSKGMCQRHYQRELRYGDPGALQPHYRGFNDPAYVERLHPPPEHTAFLTLVRSRLRALSNWPERA